MKTVLAQGGNKHLHLHLRTFSLQSTKKRSIKYKQNHHMNELTLTLAHYKNNRFYSTANDPKISGESKEEKRFSFKRMIKKTVSGILIFYIILGVVVILVKLFKIGKEDSIATQVLGESISQGLVKALAVLESASRSASFSWTLLVEFLRYKYYYWKYDVGMLEENGDKERVRELMDPVLVEIAGSVKKKVMKLGGFYIKFGQEISAMEGYLPKVFCEEMRSLLDSVTTVSFKDIIHVVEEEFGCAYTDIFDRFEEKAIASASLAQVHRAYLKDGTKVAVKVQYPVVAQYHTGDIYASRISVWVMNQIDSSIEDVPDSFYENLKKEVDFIHEAKNIELCSPYALGISDEFFYVPKVYHEYSSERVLTMEFIDGTSITDFETICDKWGFSKRTIATQLYRTFGKLIFEHGVVHGDPHAANIFVRPHPKNPKNPQIVILDHGLSDHLSDDFRIRYAQFWKALVLNDTEGQKKYCQHYGIDNYQMYTAIILMQDYNNDDSTLNDAEFSKKGKELDLENVDWNGYEDMKDDIEQIVKNMPTEMYLILRCYFLLRSVYIKLGSPINRYSTLAREASKSISISRGGILGFYDNQKFEFQLLMFKLKLWLLSTFIWLFHPNQSNQSME